MAKGQRRHERLFYRGIVACCVIVGISCILACGYGHAALSRDLMISGEASVVAEVSTFGIQYMQEMTPATCKAAKVGTSERLADKRDGKQYWVAKLADGNCWMTQNLALGLTTEGLTSELTDLQENNIAEYETTVNEAGETVYLWNANSKYYPRDTVVGPVSVSDTTANYTSAKSSNPGGDYIIAYPTVPSTKSGEKNSSLLEVEGVEVVDVTGWSPTFEFDAETGLAYDAASRTYDAHYLFGNSYQIGAATAGSARAQTITTTRQKALSSICPRGWRLPDQTSLTSNEWQVLVGKYGFTTKTSITDASGVKTIMAPPLYIPMSGYVTSGSKYYRVGQYGLYMTNRGGDTTGSWYIFMFTGTTITGSNSAGSYATRSVRCVARSE